MPLGRWQKEISPNSSYKTGSEGWLFFLLTGPILEDALEMTWRMSSVKGKETDVKGAKGLGQGTQIGSVTRSVGWPLFTLQIHVHPLPPCSQPRKLTHPGCINTTLPAWLRQCEIITFTSISLATFLTCKCSPVNPLTKILENRQDPCIVGPGTVSILFLVTGIALAHSVNVYEGVSLWSPIPKLDTKVGPQNISIK